jgi:hypothetical protein
MSDERKRFGQWIAGLLIVLPVLYVASFGPACWLARAGAAGTLTVAKLYRPLVRAARSDRGIAPVLRWYGDPLGQLSESRGRLSMTHWMDVVLDISDSLELE